MTTLVYTQDILNNLPDWWKKDEDSNNYKFVSSFETTFETTNNALTSFKEGWQINTATGTDLDKIAKKYNLIRTQYDTDISFRAKIKSYLNVLSGKGTMTDIQNILSFFTGLDADDITVTEVREMVFSISIAVDKDTDLNILADIVNIVPRIKAAGTYCLRIDYTSKNGIFLTNLSKTNNDDKIV